MSTLEVRDGILYVDDLPQYLTHKSLRSVLSSQTASFMVDLRSMSNQNEVAVLIWESLPASKTEASFVMLEEPSGFFYEYETRPFTPEEGIVRPFTPEDGIVVVIQAGASFGLE